MCHGGLSIKCPISLISGLELPSHLLGASTVNTSLLLQLLTQHVFEELFDAT